MWIVEQTNTRARFMFTAVEEMNSFALADCSKRMVKKREREKQWAIISINDDTDDTQVAPCVRQRSLEGINRHVPCISQID